MTQHLSRHASKWDERRKTAQQQIERRIAYWTKEQSTPTSAKDKVDEVKAHRKRQLERAKQELSNLVANMGKGSQLMNKRERKVKKKTDAGQV